MRVFQVLALCVAAVSLTVPAWADGPKKSDKADKKDRKDTEPTSPSDKDKKTEPDYASLLVGKWVRTDKFEGTTMEFAKNGKHTTSAVLKPGAKPIVVHGSWKIKGDQLTQTLNTTTVTLTITKLTETEFIFTNSAGMEATYERVTDKKK